MINKNSKIFNLIRELGFKFVMTPKWHLKYLLHYGRWDFFSVLSIATTTHCNFRCYFCPNSIYERGLKENEICMDRKLFYKIIHDLEKIKYRGFLEFHFYNEPLTDKRIVEFVGYAREKLPKTQIRIHTNGSLLNINAYKRLIEAGIDIFVISQYGKDMIPSLKQLYNKIEKEKIKNKIHYRIFKKSFAENVGGTSRGTHICSKPRCTYPDNFLSILPDGEVALCCNDYFNTIKIGNVKNENLIEIFDKPHFRKIRKNLKKGKFEVCKKCRGKNDSSS